MGGGNATAVGRWRHPWRQMTAEDAGAVERIGAHIHPDLPEDEAIILERLRLYPQGCRVLEVDGRIAAYVVSRPWRDLQPPPLNTLLGALPQTPTTYYIHDLALLSQARGTGAASAVVEDLLAHAAALGVADFSLIAVANSADFWRRFGFEVVADPKLDPNLRSYDEAARFMVRPL